MEPMAEASLGAREGFEKGKFRAGIRGESHIAGAKRKRSDESEGSDLDNPVINRDSDKLEVQKAQTH